MADTMWDSHNGRVNSTMVVSLGEMEAARQRMIAARKELDHYRTQSPRDRQRLHTLSNDLAIASDEYIKLVSQFLEDSSIAK